MSLLYSRLLFFSIIGFYCCIRVLLWIVFFFQAEDGIRDLVRSRGLGDVYKRQPPLSPLRDPGPRGSVRASVRYLALRSGPDRGDRADRRGPCLLYTSDAADERSSVDLGGRRIIKKKKQDTKTGSTSTTTLKQEK